MVLVIQNPWNHHLISGIETFSHMQMLDSPRGISEEGEKGQGQEAAASQPYE